MIKPAGDRWRVDVYKNGVRTRKFFNSRALARAFEEQTTFENHRVKMGIKDLNSQQYAQAVEAFRLLREGESLVSVVQQWISQHRVTDCPLEYGIETFLQEKRKENCRPIYIESTRKRLSKFQKFFGDGAGSRALSSFNRADFESFLDNGIKDREGNLGGTAITRLNNIRDLRVFFGWAKDHEYVSENIPALFKNPAVDRKAVAVLTPVQAEDMLKDSKGQDRAYAALGMFAGIRPTELERMDWAQVDLENSKVTILADISKTRSQRTVELEPNAVAWLKTVEQRKGLIWTGGKKWLIMRLTKAAKLESWPAQDVLRHSFATYHTTAFQDPGKTAMAMHDRRAPDVLFRFYYKDGLKSDALKFWQIFP
jgi:site-specific recombinase XerD